MLGSLFIEIFSNFIKSIFFMMYTQIVQWGNNLQPIKRQYILFQRSFNFSLPLCCVEFGKTKPQWGNKFQSIKRSYKFPYLLQTYWLSQWGWEVCVTGSWTQQFGCRQLTLIPDMSEKAIRIKVCHLWCEWRKSMFW